ncbi:hypothetical protein D3C77_207250 [compost metagenome]
MHSIMSFMISDWSMLRRIKDKASWKLRWLFPNHFINPSEQEYSFESDKQVNEETKPDESEEPAVQVVWGAEVYGPAEAEALCLNLARLRWVAGGGLSKRKTAAEWVREQSLYGGGGWYNVGVVTNPKERDRFILPCNYMELPAGVDYLKVEVSQLTPALTCVVVGFVLSDLLQKSYAENLRKEIPGRYFRSSRRLIGRYSPRDLKRIHIERSREDLRGIAQSWFKKNLPGFFCGSNVSCLPTAELVSTNFTSLFPDARSQLSWQNTIVSAPAGEVWSAKLGKGIKFSHYSNSKREGQFHMIAAMCKGEVDAEVLRYYGDGVGKYIYHAAEMLSETISNFAVLAYLTETLKNLKVSRSSLQLTGIARNKQISVLEEIQVFFDRSLGAPLIASELKGKARYPIDFTYRSGDYSAPHWGQKGNRSLGQFFCNAIKDMSERILAEEHSLREHFEQLANIISIRESMKAQRKTEVLTVLAVLIAAVSMVITALQSSTWVSEVKGVLGVIL